MCSSLNETLCLGRWWMQVLGFCQSEPFCTSRTCICIQRAVQWCGDWVAVWCPVLLHLQCMQCWVGVASRSLGAFGSCWKYIWSPQRVSWQRCLGSPGAGGEGIAGRLRNCLCPSWYYRQIGSGPIVGWQLAGWCITDAIVLCFFFGGGHQD